MKMKRGSDEFRNDTPLSLPVPIAPLAVGGAHALVEAVVDAELSDLQRSINEG